IAGLPSRVVSVVPREESTPDGSIDRIDLWASDGTAAGTGSVFTFPLDARSTSALSVVGNEAFFTAYTPDTTRSNLWRTDGTAAGTRRIPGFESAFANPPLTFARLGPLGQSGKP